MPIAGRRTPLFQRIFGLNIAPAASTTCLARTVSFGPGFQLSRSSTRPLTPVAWPPEKSMRSTRQPVCSRAPAATARGR